MLPTWRCWIGTVIIEYVEWTSNQISSPFAYYSSHVPMFSYSFTKKKKKNFFRIKKHFKTFNCPKIIYSEMKVILEDLFLKIYPIHFNLCLNGAWICRSMQKREFFLILTNTAKKTFGNPLNHNLKISLSPKQNEVLVKTNHLLLSNFHKKKTWAFTYKQ